MTGDSRNCLLYMLQFFVKAVFRNVMTCSAYIINRMCCCIATVVHVCMLHDLCVPLHCLSSLTTWWAAASSCIAVIAHAPCKQLSALTLKVGFFSDVRTQEAGALGSTVLMPKSGPHIQNGWDTTSQPMTWIWKPRRKQPSDHLWSVNLWSHLQSGGTTEGWWIFLWIPRGEIH